MAKGKVVELPVPQFPCCWKGDCGIYSTQRKWDEFIQYTCNTVGGSCLWRKGNVDSAVSAERMFYPQFVLKNTACEEVLLITPQTQQHTLLSKSLFHMLPWSLGCFPAWVTTSCLLQLTDAPFQYRLSLPHPKFLYRVARISKGSTPREMEVPDRIWGHSGIYKSRSQLEESDKNFLFSCQQPC